MIRVFLLALVALLALIVVAGRLPAPPADPSGAPAVPSADSVSGRRAALPDGAWEGLLKTLRPDGSTQSTLPLRLVRTTTGPGMQSLVMTVQRPEGRVEEWTGTIRSLDDGAQRILTDPNDVQHIYEGRWSGPAMIWHVRDGASGDRSSLREEVVLRDDGEWLIIDGVTVPADPRGEYRLYEARLRRSSRADR